MKMNYKRSVLIGMIILLLSAALAFPLVGGRVIYSAPRNTERALVTPPPGSTPTPTAFQPLAKTATYIPTAYPTSTPTPTPTRVPDVAKPSGPGRGADPIIQPEGQINIMILGSDQHSDSVGFRTDVMMLVTINKKDGTVSVTSFPRDLYVYIPGWTNQRLNTAFPLGGFKTLRQTLDHNFGVKPDYYVLVYLWSFKRIINDLGGITIQVPHTLCDNKWVDGSRHCIAAGRQHIYGQEALWYVRSRQTTSDFDRNKRQQQVVEAVMDRMFALNTITKIPQMYRTYQHTVTTNIPLKTVVSLIPTATKLKDKSRISQYYIDRSVVQSWVTPGGGQVLLPRYRPIREILKDALNSPY
jgi:LCP family protein required for cell wall assembly